MRRAVRRPVSRLTTAPISSSVCRLPFISASALPSRTSCDRLGGRRLAVRRIDDRHAGDVDAVLLRDRLDARARPDEDRRDQAERAPRRPRRAASSRRRDARRPSASAAATCRSRAAAGISRACCSMRQALAFAAAVPTRLALAGRLARPRACAAAPRCRPTAPADAARASPAARSSASRAARARRPAGAATSVTRRSRSRRIAQQLRQAWRAPAPARSGR